MKRFCMLIVLSIIAVAAYTQQSTTLYFTDKNGLQDSLSVVIGLSDEEIAAIPVYTPDEAEQEVKDSVHWVWLWNYMEQTTLSRVYAYKPYEGFIDGGKRWILIMPERLPVTINWDKDFFIKNDLQGSVISDMISWFDAVCGDEEILWKLLAENDSCVLHTLGCAYEYINTLLVKVLGISIGTHANFESLDDIPAPSSSATKILRDGQLYIKRDGKMYTIQGIEVK